MDGNPSTAIATGIPPELMTAYLASLDVKPRTRTAYSDGVRYYANWLASSGRDGSLREDVVAYKNELAERGYAPATVAIYLAAVRSFYAYLEEACGVPSPAKGVKSPKKAKGFARDALDAAQAKAVLEACGSLRDRAIVTLMIHTGLRTVEVVRADVGDVRMQSGRTVLYVQGKGRDSKDDFVVLTPSTWCALAEYMESRGGVPDDAPLFASEARRDVGGRLTPGTVSRIAKEAMRMAGIESDRLTAHSLRHTAVTLALQGGASLQEVQAMARHSDISTTMIYVHGLERAAGRPEAAIDSMLGGLRWPRRSWRSP